MADVIIYSFRGFGKQGTLSSSSPYCVKALDAARFKGISCDIVYFKTKMPKLATRGLLPVASIKGVVVEDSTEILHELDKAFPSSPLLFPKEPLHRAQTMLLEDWCDESFCKFVPAFRWGFDKYFDDFEKIAFGNLPLPLRIVVPPIFRRGVKKRVQSLLSLGMVGMVARFGEHVEILDSLLSEKPFLTGESANAADISCYSVLRNLQEPLIQEIQAMLTPRIRNWMEKMQILLR